MRHLRSWQRGKVQVRPSIPARCTVQYCCFQHFQNEQDHLHLCARLPQQGTALPVSHWQRRFVQLLNVAQAAAVDRPDQRQGLSAFNSSDSAAGFARQGVHAATALRPCNGHSCASAIPACGDEIQPLTPRRRNTVIILCLIRLVYGVVPGWGRGSWERNGTGG